MKNQIRLITYNILADYLNSHEFVLVDKKYIKIETDYLKNQMLQPILIK